MQPLDPSIQEIVDEFSQRNQRLEWFFQDAAARVGQDQLFREFVQDCDRRSSRRSGSRRRVKDSMEHLPHELLVATGACVGGVLGHALTSLVGSGLHAALVTGVGAALAGVVAMRLSEREHRVDNFGGGPDNEPIIIDVAPDSFSVYRGWRVISPARLGDGHTEVLQRSMQRSEGDER